MIHWYILTDEAIGLPRGTAPPPGLLNHVEAAAYGRLVTDKRRRDWLLGRLTAKKLVAGLLQARLDRPIFLDEIVIGNLASGEPYVVCPRAGGECGLTLSISHSGGQAFCAVIEQPAALLGADIEVNAPRSAGFVADYFTPAEQARVARAPGENRSLIQNAIWSAKEAALKALRLGLTVDTRAVECLPEKTLPAADTWGGVGITLDPARLGADLPSLTGWWSHGQGFVRTLVASEGAASPTSGRRSAAATTPCFSDDKK